MNFFDINTDKSEKIALNLLLDLGIKCKKNNIININDVDIITDGGIKIDVQFSNNFELYGDYRLDIVSAFFPRNICAKKGYIYNQNLSFMSNFEKKFSCKVIKLGKIFLKDYLDFIFVLFYKNKIDGRKPDFLFLASKSVLFSWMSRNLDEVFSNIIINSKLGLDDAHGSAFVPLNVMLMKKAGCMFGTPEDFYINCAQVRKYLNEDACWR